MKITQLRDSIKNNTIKNLYLFYGEEDYLIRKYMAQIKASVLQNDFDYNVVTTIEQLAENLEQYPLCNAKKLVIAKETGILHGDDKAKRELLHEIPDYAVLVFVEKDLKRVSKPLLRIIQEQGATVEFGYQQLSDLRAWTARELGNKRVSNDTLEYIVRACAFSLAKLELEVSKILSASHGKDEITQNLVENLLPKSLDFKVFDFIDALMAKQRDTYKIMLHEFKVNKEEPIVILFLIFTQINFMLMVYNLKQDGLQNGQIESFFPANRRFLAGKFIRESGKYNADKLHALVKACTNYDVAIKSGEMDAWTAIELVCSEVLS